MQRYATAWSTKFRDFCDKLEAKSESKQISSLIKYNKNTQSGSVKKPDGSLTGNFERHD